MTLGTRRPQATPPAGEPELTIAYPLDGDRFLLEPRVKSLAIPLKATSHTPLKSVTCFVDGVEAARDTQSNLAGSGTGLHIGTGATLAPGSFWKGLIDDICIYNRAVQP